MIPAILFLTLVAGPAQAQSNTQKMQAWDMNVHVVTHVMKLKDTVRCSAAQRKLVDGKAREISLRRKPGNAELEALRKQGYDARKKGEFLRYEYAIACFKDGMLGVKYPPSGKAAETHFHRPDRGWYQR